MTREELVAGAFEVIQNGSKSFRAASRLFDRTTRERAWLLYAWCRHCDDVCDGQWLGSPGGKRGSVEALKAKTRRAVAGEEQGELAFDALAQLLRECPIPPHLLDEHLEGFALDEQGWRPMSEGDLARYCYHVAGTVGCMMAVIMGVDPTDTRTLERAADLGIAFQLSNIARDLRDDHQAGRCYIPAEWLAEFGLERSLLFDPVSRSALLSIVERLIALVDTYEASARLGVDRLPFRSRLAVLAALRIYGAIGRRVGTLGAEAWDRRVTIGRGQKLAMLVPTVAEAIALGRRTG